MKTLISLLLFFAFALPASAASVVYTQLTASDDLVAAKEQLVSTFKYHLRGAQRYAAAHGPRVSSDEAYANFRRSWARASVAHVEYRWTNSRGRPWNTVYHGMSGPVASSALPRDGALVPAAYDMPDWAQYYTDHNPDVFARIPDGERSVLEQALEGDASAGVGRGYDAEIRAMRTLERDILAGNVPRGGRVVAWVSSPPCQTCRATIRLFADTYGIDVQVYHLPHVEDYDAEDFGLFQKTKNRLLHNFHLRVENERAGRVPGGRCPR